MLLGFIQPAQAGSRKTDSDSYYPGRTTYESNGSRLLVRKASERWKKMDIMSATTGASSVTKRVLLSGGYRRDHGLPIVGKIDELFLRTLGFKERDLM